MESLNTSYNYNQQSILNEKKFLFYDFSRENTNKSTNICILKSYEIKNIFNKLEYKKLSGIKKYENFPLFSVRENKSKKNKLILRLKNNSFSIKKSDGYSTSQNSIYITQNSNIGEISQLPSIYEKIENLNTKKVKKIINLRKKFNKLDFDNINFNNKEKIEHIIKKPIKYLFINRIKKSLEKGNEGKVNKSADFIINKKIYDLNRFRTLEKYPKIYLSKLNEFRNDKILLNFKKERISQIEETKKNKIESINDKILSLDMSKNLMNDNYIMKCRKFLNSIYKEGDKQDDIDNILCTKIIVLKKEIKSLEKRIEKKQEEKNIYLKWMLFQIQIKEKLLNLPKKYKNLLNSNKNIQLPVELIKYKKEIIYPTPELLFDQFKNYNIMIINSMEDFYKINNLIASLKIELEKETEKNEKLSNLDEEVKKIIPILEKFKSKNQLLNNKLNSLTEELNEYPDSTNDDKKNSKLYQKIYFIRNNLVKEKRKDKLIKNVEIEMLNMLRDIEIVIDKTKLKHKYYKEYFTDSLIIAREQVFNEKRIEKMILNRQIINEKKKMMHENIIEKAKKKILLPTIKINWNIYKINKKVKTVINDDNNLDKEEELENNFKLIQYDE